MRALFLCIDMHNGFHGSFLHTMEYAEYFKLKGYEIHIGGVLIAEENKKYAENKGFIVHQVNNVPLNQHYDFVYALHLALFPGLLARGLKYDKAITATLSAFTAIEIMPPPQLWPYFDLITAISEEAAYAHIKKYGIKNVFEVIPNHIPLAFMNHEPKTSWNKNLEKVAFISNRPMEKIEEIREYAPFQFDLIGSYYGNTKQITPEFLLEYDAVISIGKTVQYCMGLGIPVFEYAHFGGCGYITPENVEIEEKTNFSGRGTKKVLTSEGVIQSLQDGYGYACAKAPALCNLARKRYGISNLIEKQLKLISQKSSVRPPLKREALLCAEGYSAVLSYMGGMIRIPKSCIAVMIGKV